MELESSRRAERLREPVGEEEGLKCLTTEGEEAEAEAAREERLLPGEVAREEQHQMGEAEEVAVRYQSALPPGGSR